MSHLIPSLALPRSSKMQQDAVQVSQMYAWREDMNNLGSWYLLNDLNVPTSRVINRCNILGAPSRYADAPSEALPLTSARLSCPPVRN